MEFAGALLHAHLDGIPISESDSAMLSTLTDHLVTIWEQPDEGIWEMRGERKQFTYSKIMAWVGFDRAIQGAEKFGLRGEVERWRQARDKIHRDICQKAYNPGLAARGASLDSQAKTSEVSTDSPRRMCVWQWARASSGRSRRGCLLYTSDAADEEDSV